MDTHQFHRQLIWGWDNSSSQWELLKDEVRPLHFDDEFGAGWQGTEDQEKSEHDADVIDAQHGHHVVGSDATHWPGPPGQDNRHDAYFVGYMGWSPGMSSWEWQQYEDVYPTGASSSALANSAAFNAKTQGLIDQAPGLPTPEDETTSDRNKNIGIAIGVGLVTTIGLWVIFKAVSNGA